MNNGLHQGCCTVVKACAQLSIWCTAASGRFLDQTTRSESQSPTKRDTRGCCLLVVGSGGPVVGKDDSCWIR